MLESFQENCIGDFFQSVGKQKQISQLYIDFFSKQPSLLINLVLL